jgi:tetratricopeptide (TPR) repeat protein
MNNIEHRSRISSASILNACAVALALACLLLATGCDKLKARDNLNKGVQAYKSARFETAIDYFKKAVQLDPGLVNARLYLATAYSQQYIPGADTPENNQFAQQAIDVYKQILSGDTTKEQKLMALKGMASLYFGMKKMDDAKQYHQQVLQLDPNDPDTYYSIGVIDWTETYHDAAELKSKEGLKVDDDIVKDRKLAKLCQAVKEKNEAKVNEGIQMLNKALELRKDYDDAMAYLNLMYRRKADIECGDEGAREADIKTAQEWVDKTLQTKKEKAERAAGPGGITAEPTR